LPAPKRRSTQIPSRKSLKRPRRGLRWRPILRASLLCAGLLAALVLWAIIARSLAPLSNTSRSTFDAILVLGTPADSDGNPTPELLDRISEAVREYERGVAPRLIVTGGAAHNRFVEAEAMARVAQAQGVPASVILEEPHAQDTIQNACYSASIIKAHGWRSAEIVSSPSHLPRASLIFSNLPFDGFEWRMHAAPENLTPGYVKRGASFVEVLKTVRYLAWSRWLESCNS
jgi:uncharacterized SAM-binding protein YcdF (DUF218 family)